jgi:hypothetical protein
MKQQFVVTHTIRQADILALLGGSITNTPSVRMLYPQKMFVFIFSYKHNTLICWSIENRSSTFCLLQDYVSVDYNNFLFHERLVLVGSKFIRRHGSAKEPIAGGDTKGGRSLVHKCNEVKSWSRIQVVKKFLAFCRKRRFIIVIT